VIFLGTPQTEDSIYNRLLDRDYKARIWPSRYISQSDNESIYSCNVSDLCIDVEKLGRTTEPLRFSDIDLNERELSYGKSGFNMQFMLNTKRSDGDRYPLKLTDLVVMDVDNDLAPEKVVWANSPETAWDGSVPNVGFSVDRYNRPLKLIGDHIPYTGAVMSIDPSGRGKDETSWAVVKMLNGYLYVVDAGGMQGGYSEEVLKKLAMKAEHFKVNEIVVESNFGDGMFSEIFKPILSKSYPCSITEVRHNTQKEKRIIDTLEPIMNQHRLVVNTTVIREDFNSAQGYPQEHQLWYQLFYQMSRITNTRGAIRHDDRLDALAIAVNYWVEQMAQDADVKIEDRKTELIDKELDKFKLAYFNTHSQAQGGVLTWL
jgi:hypothetical protein